MKCLQPSQTAPASSALFPKPLSFSVECKWFHAVFAISKTKNHLSNQLDFCLSFAYCLLLIKHLCSHDVQEWPWLLRYPINVQGGWGSCGCLSQMIQPLITFYFICMNNLVTHAAHLICVHDDGGGGEIFPQPPFSWLLLDKGMQMRPLTVAIAVKW